MTSVKVKFRPSSVAGKEGSIYYQVIHNRVTRQIRTTYRVFKTEWDGNGVIVSAAPHGRAEYLRSITEYIGQDVKRLKIIAESRRSTGDDFTADDIVKTYGRVGTETSFFRFMEEVIVHLRRLGRERTAENYTATLNCFMRFREGRDLLLDEVCSELIVECEASMKARGLAMNTVSFYMRILRAVYNRAVEKGMTPQRNPFRRVYTGIDKTMKRAIPLNAIRRIKGLDLSMKPSLCFARDMFLFSFYTRGMSFIDMAYLKKTDLRNGILCYRRRKTGQRLFIKWEKCMQEIVARNLSSGTGFLLPIIKKAGHEQLQYRNALHLVNNKLKEIAGMAGLSANLTMYVSRHSWASIARIKNVPLSVISEGMGHGSEATTRIYLASLDQSLVDDANEMILSQICH